ncbi:TAFII55 protein conserved region-domain-containing protein [Thamnocephalis sphaerospora]|uniref:TAFII55 protein conserved region-domain-containing protein n=1 Tax=Thamnocephalis sphaerospora TaxID=78915 RepID=A0A4V1IW62_9FUNG|nr:TAFII55 protein conserved region-domain-containing protein [Thamnocephalis sphaerospora]|eukprot:RKP06449.1 TAFII55 protein conserved region-domain-containing protein [Thamnocephalis sphaerospora]
MSDQPPPTPTSGLRIKLKTTAGGAHDPAANATPATPQSATPRIRIKPLGKEAPDGLPPELENLTRFEDHFLLRLPHGEALDRLRREVRERTISDNVAIRFADSRHAQIELYGEKFRARLVDLPCIIEAQKTFDRKQFFKVGDVSQMLVAEVQQPEVQPSRPLTGSGLSWPDGISAPLRDVRKRRFRKRVSKQKIEIIERQVEELLKKDAAADEVIYEVHDLRENPTPSEYDLGDSSMMHMANEYGAGTDGRHPGAGSDIDLEGYDSDLAAEIGRGLEQLEEGEGDEDDDRESSESGSGEDDDEEEEEEGDEEGGTDEASVQRRLLQEEVAELESSLQRKRADIASATNPIVKKRLQGMAEKLETELELKRGLLQEARKR